MSARPAAVVLGMCPTGLAVVRALGRAGVRVWGVDADARRAAFSSRFCRKLAILDGANSGAEFVRRLVEFASTQPTAPVLFGTEDGYLLLLAQHHEVLHRHYRFPHIDPELLDKLVNKRTFYELCASCGVPYPATHFVDSEADVRRAGAAIRYPAIIKPIYTHLWAKSFGLRKVFEVHSAQELLAAFRALGAMQSNVLIQEVVPGKDDQIYFFAGYFDAGSRPLRSFTGRKIRQYPPGFGTTTTAESLHEPKVAELSIRILEALRFQGLCDVEFKKDPRDGTFKMIEVNPRVGRWYGLAEAAGVDIGPTAYMDLAGHPVDPRVGFAENAKWVFLYRDVMTAVPGMLAGSIGPLEWLRSLRGRPRQHAVLAWDDPLPALAYLGELLSKGWSTTRARLRAAGTRSRSASNP